MSGSDSMDLRSGVSFTSSNERLLKLFIKWLVDIGKIPIEELSFTLYMNIYSEDKAGKSISNRKDIANSIYDNIEGERDASDMNRFDDSNDDNKINDIASDIHRSINDNEDEININKRIIADESSIDVFKKSSDLISLSTEDKKQISISTWARKLKITESQISHTYITTVKKKKGVRVNIRNTPQNGFIRIRVIKSSMLARQIAGWIEGISQRLEI